jgi:hypothetical protein
LESCFFGATASNTTSLSVAAKDRFSELDFSLHEINEKRMRKEKRVMRKGIMKMDFSKVKHPSSRNHIH